MGTRKYNQKEIVDMYDNGLTMNAIAKKIGCSHAAVSRNIYRSKHKIRDGRTVKNKIPTSYLQELYSQGLGTPEIGKRIGLTAQAVYERLLKSGVQMRSWRESVKIASQQGRHKNQIGCLNSRWKGGKSKNKYGYIEVRVNCKQVPEHRYIWEQHNGILPEKWVVHHLNGIKDDNRIENLIAVSRKQHSPLKILEPYQERIRLLEEEIYQLKKL